MPEYRQAYCPVCFMSHGRINTRMPGKPYIKLSSESFWERACRIADPYHPFGSIQEMGVGRGTSGAMVGHFDIDDDPDGYYPFVKKRLLGAVTEWIAKGWLTVAEVETALAPWKS